MFRPLTRTQLIVDIVIGALFALVVIVPEVGFGREVTHNALSSVLVVVAMAGALALRRLSPGGALALAWLGAIIQMSFGRPPTMTDIPVFVVLFASAAYGSRRVFWAGFASVLVGAGVIVAYLFIPVASAIGEWSTSTVSVAIAVGIAALFGLGLSWTVGALVRTGIRARANRRAQEIAEAQTAAEAERTRIARDMHDVVAHSLAVVIAQADGARYAAASDPLVAGAALETISTTARAALSDVRMLLTQLRHQQAEGPQPMLADLEQLYAQVRAAGVELRIEVDPMPLSEPPAAVQLAVYRILQEALTNALRHGAGGVVEVRLAWHAEGVEFSVRNPVSVEPGAGVAADGSRGHGVIGMRERAQLVGGHLDAGPDGGAFAVSASLPIRVTAL